MNDLLFTLFKGRIFYYSIQKALGKVNDFFLIIGTLFSLGKGVFELYWQPD